jgi:hypothetical protein
LELTYDALDTELPKQIKDGVRNIRKALKTSPIYLTRSDYDKLAGFNQYIHEALVHKAIFFRGEKGIEKAK